MATALLLVALAALVALLTALQAARRAWRARAARALGRALTPPLRDVQVLDPSRARGTLDGLAAEVNVTPSRVTAEIALPDAVLDYAEVLERFASDALRAQLDAAGAGLAGPARLCLALERGASLADDLAALSARLEVAREVAALRRFAPVELASRIPRARGAAEVDAILDGLARTFPEAPETRVAFAAAMARDPDPRLAARAAALGVCAPGIALGPEAVQAERRATHPTRGERR